jgi:hypothetical protein
MEFIDPDKITSDTDKLDAILKMMENVLDEVARSGILFRHNLRDDVLKSWEEIRPNIERMRDRLREQPEGLAAAGLTGSNLNMKYLATLESYADVNKSGGTRRVKKFLRWAGIVVGSLATMVPGLKELAEILREYMEAIDMGIEDAESA